MDSPLLLVHVPGVLKDTLASGKGMALLSRSIGDELLYHIQFAQLKIPGVERAQVGAR